MITKFYYSANDVINCTQIALVNSTVSLMVSRIPNYNLSDDIFTEYTIVPKNAEGRFKHQILVDGVYHHVKFNYILILDNIGKIRGFTELDSQINTADFYCKTVSVEYDLTVVDQEYKIDVIIDYTEHEYNIRNVHKKLFKVQDCSLRTVPKKDVLKVSNDNQVFTSDVRYLLETKGAIMRYSGNFMEDNGVYEGNRFIVTGIPEGQLLGFITINDNQTLVQFKDGALRFILDTDHTSEIKEYPINFTPVEICDHYIIDTQRRLYLIEDIMNGDLSPIQFDSDMNYIKDEPLGKMYFYKFNSLGDYETVSKGLERILNNVQSDNSFGKLLAATPGLLIYEFTDDSEVKSTILVSYKPVKKADGQPSMILTNYQIKDTFIHLHVLSGELFLATPASAPTEIWMYDVSKVDVDYEWTATYIGNEKYLKNIHMLAKSRTTNPLVRLSPFCYKGNVYKYTQSGSQLLLGSL